MTAVFPHRSVANGYHRRSRTDDPASYSSFPASRASSSPRSTATALSNRDFDRASLSSKRPSHRSQPSNGSARSGAPSTFSTRPHENNSPQSHLGSAHHASWPAAREVQSAYPPGGENHVEYILVASFDIDRGSIMEHQYPGPISGDEHMLAELMLPDQAHVRSQDWTIFFLHKDTDATRAEQEAERKRRKRRRRKGKDRAEGEDGEAALPADGEEEAEEDEEEDGGETDGDEDGDDEEADETVGPEGEEDEENFEGPPLIYVLNLVNTKQDSSVKRGAICKAMAICTPHPFLDIYKPLLLLALEEYFRAPVPETLASLYNAVNNMDLSLMPKLSLMERAVLEMNGTKDMFIEKFKAMIDQRMAIEAAEVEENGKDESEMSRLTQSKKKYLLPRDTHFFDSTVLYNNIPVPIRVPLAHSSESIGDFSLIGLIERFAGVWKTNPQAFNPLHPHLTTSGQFTHPIIVLLNALLTQKRIVFLGHNLPSSLVSDFVLAACHLASGSGVLRGFARYAFPYTDLTKIDDLLKVPGYVAGVTNPAFASKYEWWDVLCDVGTGKIKISPKIEAAALSEGQIFFATQASAAGAVNGLERTNTTDRSINGATQAGADKDKGSHGDPTGDNAFIASLLESIRSRHGEQVIRSKTKQWILKFIRLVGATEELVYGASALHIGSNDTDSPDNPYGVSGHGYVWPSEGAKMAELAANVARIEAFRQTRPYYTLIQSVARIWSGLRCKILDLRHQHSKLASLKLGSEASAAIYLALSRAVEAGGDDGIQYLPPLNLSDDSSPVKVIRTADPRSEEELDVARYETILELLSVLPPGESGGLFHMSLGLFHPRKDVREATALLLRRIGSHEAGRHFVTGLGGFGRRGFRRVNTGVKEDDA